MSIVLHVFVMLIGVFIASLAQVLLKKSSQKQYNNKLREYLNWRVLTGYSMMITSSLCTVFAYRVLSISQVMVLETSSYIYITIFGRLVFKESVSLKRIVALILIISGITIYAIIE